MLVDDRIRGGGARKWRRPYEECRTTPGPMLTAHATTWCDELELPDIVCAQIETQTKQSHSARGLGEAGTAGAPAAVMTTSRTPFAFRGPVNSAFPGKILMALKN